MDETNLELLYGTRTERRHETVHIVEETFLGLLVTILAQKHAACYLI